MNRREGEVRGRQMAELGGKWRRWKWLGFWKRGGEFAREERPDREGGTGGERERKFVLNFREKLHSFTHKNRV